MQLLRRRLVVVGALVATLTAASAARADESRPLMPAAEAWYPSGVGDVLAPTRPAGTLHVGMVAGQETDRSYLRFAVAALPADAEIDRVTLTLPVAEASSAPEMATILACAVPGGFEDGGGGEAPEASCDAAPELSFVAGEEPSFTADVTPLVAGDVLDVALVPGGGDSWHVSFDGRHRDGGDPAVVAISYSVPTPTTRPASVSDPPPPAPRIEPPSAPASPFAAPQVSRNPVSPGQAIVDEAAASSRPDVVTSAPIGGSSGFRYAAVFGLPLVLLVVVAVMGDGLTRPVRLRERAP